MCAGEPGRNELWDMNVAVYPRVCGGTQKGAVVVVEVEGLSPCVRGNLVNPGALALFVRSIPVCAGEPGRPASLALHAPVYPRVCGGTRVLALSSSSQ